MSKALTYDEQIAILEEAVQEAEKTMQTITDLKEKRKWMNTIVGLNRVLTQTKQLHQEYARMGQPKRTVTDLAAEGGSS